MTPLYVTRRCIMQLHPELVREACRVRTAPIPLWCSRLSERYGVEVEFVPAKGAFQFACNDDADAVAFKLRFADELEFVE